MYELSIIKSFLDKRKYQQYRSFVTDKEVSEELRPIFKALDEWYTQKTGSPTLEDVANLTFARGIKERDREYTKTVFDTLQRINGEETVITLLEGFKTNRVLSDLALASHEASEGRRGLPEVLELVEKLKTPEKIQFDYVTDDLEEILCRTIHAPGLRWRLDSLNKSLGSLRKGNFGFVFARPETGKTTFLASEVTYMASQVSSEAGPIIWINNEEKGESVKKRIYQGALGARIDHLEKHTARAQEAYLKATNGKLKLLDRAGIHRKEVESICQNEAPSLLVFDQIDKIKGFKADRP